MKKLMYAGAAVALTALNSANAINFGEERVQGGVKGTENSAEVAIQNIVTNVMVFLSIVAVLILLWGGFNILTASGDEEKVKKGKTIIIQAAAGLVVIFLANSVITWVLGLFTGA